MLKIALSLFAGSGIGLIVLGSIYLSRGEFVPYRVLLPGLAAGYSSLLCYATYTVIARTPAEPPLALTIALVCMSVLASILLVLATRNSPEA